MLQAPTPSASCSTVDALNHECPRISVEANQWSGQIGQQTQRQGPLRTEEKVFQLKFYYAGDVAVSCRASVDVHHG
ncbi:hypothetical protein JOB18_006621 [Solea senegalensis]|uniref:Uncharacterized protein n=1 Tax=Solea senegalensis TaxID=28829 RepID=A0AAV6PKF8_SOLSE|nr:hypothetical protein JOB18_006621 [Solea senegalensis]